MKRRPILDPRYMISDEVHDFIDWYVKCGLEETAQIYVAGYRYDIHEHMELEKMKHRNFWSKSSL